MAAKKGNTTDKIKVQVLAAVMYQKDHSLLDKLNIQTDAIIGNQGDYDSVEHFTWKGHSITYLNNNERGVGLNRNNTLMRADGGICLFADDDIVYVDNYSELIQKEYINNPRADIIVFNVKESRNGESFHDRIFKDGFVGRRGVSSFATFMISARTDRLRNKNICFHQMFGGGAKYSHGEDTIFLHDCISKGLRVYASCKTIGTVTHSDSTWFEGYTDKYFRDTGVLFYYMYPRLSAMICIYHVIKHRKSYSQYGLRKAFQQMYIGIKDYRNSV